jgi:hypothetical protein
VRPPHRLAAVAAAAAAAIGLATLAACGTAPASSDAGRSPQSTPNSHVTPAATPFATPAGAVAIDPALLEHLPAAVDGLVLAGRPESDLMAASDPVVVQFGEAVATALAIDAPSGEFAYASVVRLRPGVFDEELFRSWRASFDEGACSQAGGLARTATARLGGREVHIGTCAGGVRTYHAWLGNSRVLVSVSSLGERRLGERLVEALED